MATKETDYRRGKRHGQEDAQLSIGGNPPSYESWNYRQGYIDGHASKSMADYYGDDVSIFDAGEL